MAWRRSPRIPQTPLTWPRETMCVRWRPSKRQADSLTTTRAWFTSSTTTRPDAYRLAADVVNDGPCDVVSLQHEFGLYPGEWGSRILSFVRACRKPIVTTFHTLLSRPEPLPRRLDPNLGGPEQGVVVMTNVAARLLAKVYRLPNVDIQVIPHGVPGVAFESDDTHKARLGLTGRRVICTFGLINRGKGLEYMIQAMPRIVAAFPDAIYVIVGATHPQVKRQEGEVYRESLVQMAEALGVGDTRALRQSIPRPAGAAGAPASLRRVRHSLSRQRSDRQRHIGLCHGRGRAIVSTPYLYAKEVLAKGRGLLVPFADSDALADATLRYFTDAGIPA